MVNIAKEKKRGIGDCGVIPGITPSVETFSSGKFTVAARMHGTSTKKTIMSMHSHAILKSYIAYTFQVG
jgi:hypothetical protein